MGQKDTVYIMQGKNELPRDYIKHLIEDRAWAGFRD